MTKNLNCR